MSNNDRIKSKQKKARTTLCMSNLKVSADDPAKDAFVRISFDRLKDPASSPVFSPV